MNIKFANATNDSIIIIDGDTCLSMGYPVITRYKEMVDKWIEDGNEIQPYEDPVDYMELMRKERNQLLLESDWTQLADSPLSTEDKESWSTYRQSLRDMPQNNNPSNKTEYDNLTWPTKP